MSEFFPFFNNSVLFWSLLSCLIAQFFKIVFNFISTGELRFGIMFETGGMPSSHSALITGAASGIGYELGFDSSIFALSVAVALIVMYDASGVRKSAGIQAAEINKLSKKPSFLYSVFHDLIFHGEESFIWCSAFFKSRSEKLFSISQ